MIKLDPLGGKILAAFAGIGGEITMDSQGNIYVVGLQFGGTANPLPVTPGAFQGKDENKQWQFHGIPGADANEEFPRRLKVSK